jgi:hypothetical protein
MIWAEIKWGGYWQISLYMKKKQNQYSNPDFLSQFRFYSLKNIEK